MKSQVLFEDDGHQWIVLGRDPEKDSHVVDTNEYVIISNGQAMLLDPGGTEIFPSVLAELTKYIPIHQIRTLFASHQDPDIISSLPIWLDLIPEVKVYCSWLWTGFISHFGSGDKLESIPDEGRQIQIGDLGKSVEAIPAHYCHSSGNYSIFDPYANILFSGDIGAALLPDHEASLFVTDFEQHIKFMKGFHQRWMPSNQAKQDWVRRVKKLDIEMMVPQHGRIFRGDNVAKFLDWFEALEVGIAVH